MAGGNSAPLVPHVPGATAPNYRSLVRRRSIWAAYLGLFFGVVSSTPAQPMPLYGSGAYPPGYGQPIQPAQNVYYGNYQNNTVPGYIYPRNYPPQNYYNANGNGITYYYVQNPNGPNSYPLASPYGTPRS